MDLWLGTSLPLVSALREAQAESRDDALARWGVELALGLPLLLRVVLGQGEEEREAGVLTEGSGAEAVALALVLGQGLEVSMPLPQALGLELPEVVKKVVGGALEVALPQRVVRGLVALALALLHALPTALALAGVVGEAQLEEVAVGQPRLLALALEDCVGVGVTEGLGVAQPVGVCVVEALALALLVKEVLAVVEALGLVLCTEEGEEERVELVQSVALPLALELATDVLEAEALAQTLLLGPGLRLLESDPLGVPELQGETLGVGQGVDSAEAVAE